MAYIDQIQQIMYEFLGLDAIITDNPNTFSRQSEDVHTVLSPSNVIKSMPHLDIQTFDAYLITLLEAQSKVLLETRKNILLKMRTNSLVGYQYTKRVTFTVADAAGFSEGETVHDADSSGTGVISRMSGSTIELREVGGVWANGDAFTNDVASTTLTTAETIEYYPLALDVKLTKSGMNGYQLNVEGRWALQ